MSYKIEYKGATIRLYPKKKQEEKLRRIFQAYQLLYNEVLSFLNKKKEEEKDYQPVLGDCYRHLRKEILTDPKNDYLHTIDKDVLNQAVKKSFDKFVHCLKKEKPVSFLSFHQRVSLRIVVKDKSTFLNRNQRRVQLKSIGFIPYRGLRSFKGRLFEVHLIKNTIGVFTISFRTQEMFKPIPINKKKAIGIDLGLENLFTDSNGKMYINPRFLERSLKHLARYQRKLAKKIPHSKNYEKLKKKIARLYQHIEWKRQQVLHYLSMELVKENTFIAIEDLGIKRMMSERYGRSFQDASLGDFVKKLTYKCRWNNRVLQKVSPYYPSSQLCSCCHYQNEEIKDLSIRTWTCPQCQHVHDRDHNAAVNILEEGKRLYLEHRRNKMD